MSDGPVSEATPHDARPQDVRPEDGAPDPVATERSAIAATGLLGAVLGWGAGVALYFLLRTVPVAREVAWHGWLLLACLLALSWGWLFARVMRRHFEKRRRLAAKLAELMKKLGEAPSAEVRDTVAAAIDRVEDEQTRAFLLAHFQGKKTTSA
jgi:hypothetical protein